MAANRNSNRPKPNHDGVALLLYLLLGIGFGIVLVKSEVLSWFRIQEMFRFQSPRMYEIIASAVLVAAASLALLKRLPIRTLAGEPIVIRPLVLGNGVNYLLGGSIFGVGWALTGACPGPLFALAGAGVSVMLAAIVSALAGTWVYGFVRTALPLMMQGLAAAPSESASEQ